MSGNVLEIRDGAVLRVRLNRPDRRNVFDADLIADLTDCFTRAAGIPDLRVVILEGEGPVFCGGADLEWMRRAATYTDEQNRADAGRMAAMFESIASCPMPVLARVHGAALGGGMGLVAACDIAIAATATVFGFTEVRLGIIPAVISPFVLAKVAPAHARRYFLTGERFDADEAYRIGLVDLVVEPDRLAAAVDGLLKELLLAGPIAQREAKMLLREIRPNTSKEITEKTAAWIARLRAGEEAREGMNAFFERRPPRWVVPGHDLS